MVSEPVSKGDVLVPWSASLRVKVDVLVPDSALSPEWWFHLYALGPTCGGLSKCDCGFPRVSYAGLLHRDLLGSCSLNQDLLAGTAPPPDADKALVGIDTDTSWMALVGIDTYTSWMALVVVGIDTYTSWMALVVVGIDTYTSLTSLKLMNKSFLDKNFINKICMDKNFINKFTQTKNLSTKST